MGRKNIFYADGLKVYIRFLMIFKENEVIFDQLKHIVKTKYFKSHSYH